MTARPETLPQYLARQTGAPEPLRELLAHVAAACSRIAGSVRRGALAGVLGTAGSENVQGEVQKKLDLLANDILIEELRGCRAVAGLASEEMDTVLPMNSTDGTCLLLFDPLDGSSNIDVNVSIGTIFSVLPMPRAGQAAQAGDFLQPGHRQLAAGYCVYGPQTTLVLTLGQGVVEFTLDPEHGDFLRVGQNLQIPADTQEFAINMSNMRHWDAPVQRYIDECLAGSTGPRQKDFNMRWVASMVADVHRVMTRGGVFMYPWDRRTPERAGKLRLMYEANPMAWLVEQAGGAAICGRQRILDVQPQGLHERVGVILGSGAEVERLGRYHAEAASPS